MTEEQKRIQKKKLERVTDAEWEKAMATLSDYITWKLRGRTLYGAHSEKELGQRAVSFYMREAYLKLAEYVWEWKEEHTLEEQLMRIASNLIQKREDKYRRNAGLGFKIQDSRLDIEAVIPGGLEPEEERLLDVAYEKAEAAVKGDAELERFLEAIAACNSCKDMCEYLNCDISAIYNTKKKFVRRLKGFQVS